MVERRRIGGILSAALIALVGASTTALRGAAESAAVAPTTEAGQAFDAPPVDWSFMGPADEGLFVVRPRRMTQRAALAPLVQFMQGAMDSADAEGDPPPAWRPRLDTIDYYAIRLIIGAHLLSADAAPEEQGASISGDLAIRFHDEKSANDFWAQAKVTPDAEVVEQKGFTYVRTAVEGVGAMHAAKRDALTYVFSDNLDRLRKMVEHAAASPNGGAAAPWKSLDGGLATAYGGKRPTELGLQVLMSMFPAWQVLEQPLVETLTAVHNDIQSLGFGLDVDPETNEVVLRLKAQCHDAAAVERVKASIAVAQAFAKEEFEGLAAYAANADALKSLDEPSRAAFDSHFCWTRLVAEATLETKHSEGETVELQVNASAPLPPRLGALPIFQPALMPR